MHYTRGCCFVLIFLAVKGFAQPTLPVPVNIKAAYSRETRSADGKPGKNYWQNKADYNLTVHFNPDSRELSGNADIGYFNNSPDTLHEIWFKLYPNLYKKGNARARKIDPDDVTDGVQIQRLSINGSDSSFKNFRIDGTNMIVRIDPLYPRQTIHFSVDYSYTLNKKSHIRTGEIEPGADFVAYFFPRIAVYDDIDGWNRNPYNGSEEFYNDFCHFFGAITVPAGYTVWATGNLGNAREVLSDSSFARLQRAEKTETPTTIIDSLDLWHADTANSKETTWQFEADQVTDFVFATSNHYIWQASSPVTDPEAGTRTRVDAVFNPRHASFFRVLDYSVRTVKAMSYNFPKWPFPYPHETVFDGLDQMEYPMMVNDNPLESKADDIELTDHEIFHTMFPFYMGINETKYGWMDEGWATIGEWLLSPMIDTTLSDDYGMIPYERAAGTESDPPITTLTTQLSGLPMFINSYPKPGLGYLFIKDMLGDSLFTKALHFYIGQWHGRHPMPYDFFNSMNTGAGRNMDWFWKRWFFDAGIPNLAITQVLHKGKDYAAVISMKGSKPVPVDLTICFDDGTRQLLHRDISWWQYGNTAISIPFHTDKPVKKLVLGSVHIPDSDKSDNEFEVR